METSLKGDRKTTIAYGKEGDAMRFRKWIALILSALMLLSLLPVGATAAGGYDITENSGECPSGGTHHWCGWYYPSAPTCTEGADVSWYCDKCGIDKVSHVGPLGHDWGPWMTITEATCTEEGQQVRNCNRCGARELGTIPALGHAWHEETTSQKDPTCTEDGYKQYRKVCSRCGAVGETGQDTIPALGHDWGDWKTTKDPVCEHTGLKEHKCKRCGIKEEKKINAIGHLWDSGVVTREATPEQPGEITYTCQRDPSHTYTEEFPYNGVPEPPLPPPVPAPDPEPDPEPDPIPEPQNILLDLKAVKNEPIKPKYELNDTIGYTLTLTNLCGEAVKLPRIYARWVEEDTLAHTYSDDMIILAPDESFTVVSSDHIISDDIINGQVSFEFEGTATTVEGELNVFSNKVTLVWETEDQPPEPPDTEEIYSLYLDVYKVYPKSEYIVDGMGDTEEIPYYVTVTNQGNMPINFSDLIITINGTNILHVEPTQYLLTYDPYSFYVYGTVLNETQITPGTETTETLGVVTVSFTAIAHDPYTGAEVCTSNTVDLDHTLKEPGPWTPDIAKLEVQKVETSTHVNPKGYMLDDVITYDIIVTNTGDVMIPTVEVHDDLFDDGAGSDILCYLSNIDPAESRVVPFSYQVTQADVDAGFVLNTASAEWQDPVTGGVMVTPGLPVKSPTTDEPLPGGLVIVKSVISSPANGAYYTPGETITFHIAVTNTMDITIQDIWVYDTYNPPVYIGSLIAHDTFEWSYDYVATDYDAEVMGYVSNIAYGWGYTGTEYKYGTSNEVTVPVHFDPPKNPALLLTKEEVSTPANHMYYTVGEEIVYKITCENIGDDTLYDISLYDSLDNPPVEFAHIGVLPPGDKQSVTYKYTVIQDDVDYGYVENWAIADYWPESEGGTWYSEYAGPVYSPTNEKYTIKEYPLPGKDDSCKVTLTGAGQFTIMEEQHYCATHKETADQVAALTAAAVTDAEKAAAWQQGVQLWSAAVDAEYDDLLKDADGALRLAVMEDREQFRTYFGALGTVLQTVYTADQTPIFRILCTVLEKHCTELCYLHGNAGKARPDSMISGNWKAIENDAAWAECEATRTPIHNGDTMIKTALCEEHGKIQNTAIYLVKGVVSRDTAEDTFRRVRRVWQGSLDQATNAKYRAAAGDGRTAVAKYRMAFDQMVEKRTDMLNLLYPDNPEIVAEVISDMLRDEVLFMCGGW